MSGILDSMMTKPQVFSPQSVPEYMALQLAKKLGDTDRLSKYGSLFDRLALPVIVEAFINAKDHFNETESLDMTFEKELAALTMKDDDYEL